MIIKRKSKIENESKLTSISHTKKNLKPNKNEQKILKNWVIYG